MEQIVKIFVHQSYFIENDLVVDYNVEQGAQVNISPKDWIALIPKGWSGVDEQVAFKTVETDCDIVNLAIKSVIMEKKCFQNVVECEKQYQLMYIGQYLEILGRSEYFVFLHQSGTCNCISSSTKTESKDYLKQNRFSSVFSRKPPRRQSPTPCEFYKIGPHSQNSVIKNEKSKTKQWSTNKCVKCNASNNFTALESAYLAKIQDLTINNEMMEQRLLKVENDLVHTLDVVNKQFKLNKTISQQKDDIQKFIDEVVDGLMIDGKITFWAHEQEFSVVREFPDKNYSSLSSDDCTTVSINKSFNSSKEAYMKAIIGQQEQTIQNLVTRIKDSFDLFLKVTEQNNPTSYENKINNVGYIDISGTTYYSPPPYVTDTLNDINLYLSNKTKFHQNNTIENDNELANNNINCSGLINSLESKVIPMLHKEIDNKTFAFESLKKDTNEYTLYTPFSENLTNIPDKHDDLEGSDDSL